mmetsp:Transcript_65126/g.128806  ORF Transcript_65126/g.128806 Transcript_65126/m.128806 type:complete len:93 (+) Transcript_65126:271-549(+)
MQCVSVSLHAHAVYIPIRPCHLKLCIAPTRRRLKVAVARFAAAGVAQSISFKETGASACLKASRASPHAPFSLDQATHGSTMSAGSDAKESV